MEINKSAQNNQGMGIFKVLSSNAGVGSIITTKSGFFIMPQSASFWGFIKAVNQVVDVSTTQSPTDIAKRAGVNIINDPRFVEFLKTEQGVNNLRVLVDIPHLALSDFNYPKFKEHPLFVKFKKENPGELRVEHFTIPAVYYPQWFYSRKHFYLKPLSEWEGLWREKGCNHGRMEYFAPPRDPYTKTERHFKDGGQVYDVYAPLVQIPMLLICKNGHISDIPWYNLFCAGIDNRGRLKALSKDSGVELFDYDCQPCSYGGKHDIQWIENRNSSESWGTLKCKKCGATVSLEGIMNIKPFCKAETPWNGIGTRSQDPCKDEYGNRTTMQMALVTSNSIYYADSFSSLFIPTEYLPNVTMSDKLQRVYQLLVNKWYKKAEERTPGLTKIDYWNSIDIIDKADESADIQIDNTESGQLERAFLDVPEEVADLHEKYRYDEYSVFANNESSIDGVQSLSFKGIELPTDLKLYFKKIQQVDTLALTQTQLGFSRVAIPSSKWVSGKVCRERGQHIYNEPVEQVYALPANQAFGEGIFFEFDQELVDQWGSEHQNLEIRYDTNSGELNSSLKEELVHYGTPKFYLLHTFSHIILKELEFTCGYPTASLQERLYYSDRMCGVLIYTSDGSEGSMGGLVWQAQPKLIDRIIKSAIHRAEECTSDPLCWENESQMNLAACFSCCLVSETSCEKRNLGLDRRALIDPEFGFFKDLL